MAHLNNPFYQLTAPTLADGTEMNGLRVTARGELLVALGSAGVAAGQTATPADATSNTAVNASRVQAYGMVFNGTTWDRMRKPNATSRIVSAAATTNATVAKASAGDLHLVRAHNAAAALRFLKIYNKATAPTVGTDVPVFTIAIPAGTTIDVDFAGHFFTAGIAYALTVNAADNDTTALTLADVVGLNISYS